MWQTRVTVQNTEFLAKLTKAVSVDDKVLSEIGRKFVDLVKQQFAQSKDPDGIPWKQNSSYTIKKKKSSRPLIDTGELQKSILTTRSGSTVSVELSRKYPSGSTAAVHQTGNLVLSGRPGGFLPQRKILPDVKLPVLWADTIKQVFLSRINAAN